MALTLCCASWRQLLCARSACAHCANVRRICLMSVYKKQVPLWVVAGQTDGGSDVVSLRDFLLSKEGREHEAES